MRIKLMFPALLVALFAGPLLAQAVRPGFPGSRVRMVRPVNHAPEPYYHQNRVVLRHLEIVPAAGGMQISGDVFTDFDCDQAPAALKAPPGQVMGLKIDVQLYNVSVVIKRDRNGIVLPKLDVRAPGRPVEGQSAQARTDQVREGFGNATFKLPALERPLAPGVYQLVVSLVFQAQDSMQREQIKWCSDFWGEEDEGEDPITNQRVTHKIIGDKERHERYFKQLLEVERKVETAAVLYIADTLTKAGPVLRGPYQGNDRNPANYVVWDDLIRVISDVEDLENQYPSIDKELADFEANQDLIDRRLADLRQRNPRATQADVIKMAREEAKATKKRVDDLITQNGGKANKEESRARAAAIAARTAVLEQIMAFQQYLIQRYWVLVDGYLPYAGWHTVNKPGYNAFQACNTKDNRKDTDDRIAKLDAIRAAPGGEQAAKQKRDDAWKYFPAETRKVAFNYLDTAAEKADYDSKNFTKKMGQEVILDVPKWITYRTKWMEKFLKDTNPIFDEIDTSILYANQVWPEVLAEARAAREDAICNSLAWEFHTRTSCMKETAKTVADEWTAEAQANPALGMQNYMDKSKVAPGSVKTRFDAHLTFIKDTLFMPEFISAYRNAIDANAAVLPGTKPVAR